MSRTTLKDNLEDIQKIAKERTVRTQNVEYDLETLVKKIDKDVIKLDPEYQRRHRWGDETSSKLIESLILNIPIPMVYISQDVDVDVELSGEEATRYSIIDGQQRCTAIYEFMKNKLVLSNLEVLENLNGSYFKDLPPFLIRRLEERTLKCLRIDSTLDEQIKYDIFERLNSGSVKLEPQELRNAVARGPFNELIKNLAKWNTFKGTLTDDLSDKDTAKIKKMEDVQLVLRFFAFSENGYKNIKGTYNDFLTNTMIEKNKLSEKKLKELKNMFKNAIEEISSEFGDYPFAKYKVEDGKLKNNKDGASTKSSKVNSAVFDALSVGVSHELRLNKKIPINFKKNFIDLFENPKFFDSVDKATNHPKRVETRINMVRDLFK